MFKNWFDFGKSPRMQYPLGKRRPGRPKKKEWREALLKFLLEWKRESALHRKIEGPRMLNYLTEKGWKVGARSIGWQMKRWGFPFERKQKEGVLMRWYKIDGIKLGDLLVSLEKKKRKKGEQAYIVGAVAMRCFYPECSWRGYYLLKPGERFNERGNRVLSEAFPSGRLTICPRCHPLKRPNFFGGGVRIVYARKDRENYRSGDGQPNFFDQYPGNEFLKLSKDSSQPYSSGFGPRRSQFSEFERDWW